MNRIVLLLLLSSLSTLAFADDHPPRTITSAEIATIIAGHYLEYMQPGQIGECFWYQPPYKLSPTPELDEYLPDLVVAVYNEAGDDPWFEASSSLDPLALDAGKASMQTVTGNELTNGHDSAIRAEGHNDSDITKSVDVIGSPMNLLHIPYIMLRPDTGAFIPYFQSDLDSVPGRFGLAEDLRFETWKPFGNYIGDSDFNHWAYEFPRSMTVDNNNDFKASVSIALHAADIVTNKNTGHIVKSTENSCGTNCAVSNVIEEKKDDNEIWQEVYPIDRHIKLGESDATSTSPIGQEDYKAGNGNYVFVIWRHYRGCVQSTGKFLGATVTVPPTIKR